MKHIVVTTDFSEEARAAYPHAIEQLRLYGTAGAKLTLLTVVEAIAEQTVVFGYGAAYVDYSDFRKQALENVKTHVEEERAKYFADNPVDVAVHRAQDVVHAEIINFAKEKAADLLVMASHGRSGFQHLLLGSVVERVLRGGTVCPVLVIPAGEG